MKKLIMATFVVATAMLSACHNNAPKANLETVNDSLSYEAGLYFSNEAKMAMEQLMLDSTVVDELVKGIKEGMNIGEDAKKKAYILGLQIGYGADLNFIPHMESLAFAGDSTQTISRKNFLAALISVVEGKDAPYVVGGDTISVQRAGMVLQKHVNQCQEAVMEKKFGEYKKQNAEWLAENAKKEGVVTLESGVQYKVLKEGKGEIPAKGKNVKVGYEGRLIDGTVFDSSENRPDKAHNCTVGVGAVIKGWDIVLEKMPVGSEWEVYIPAELGYGGQQAGQITPFSTLIFKMTLVGINE